ncbi:hypothetical protein Ocin01_10027 [Orchesella cincta]|uniref:F-box domain-containing protein n=1 Tax=Orchesella cincta TaxID=48709 RepID=A0A1D2MUD0_ORCCI|nr:hypothetical protein Ocin01_10027 [Orchesella cincta]
MIPERPPPSPPNHHRGEFTGSLPPPQRIIPGGPAQHCQIFDHLSLRSTGEDEHPLEYEVGSQSQTKTGFPQVSHPLPPCGGPRRGCQSKGDLGAASGSREGKTTPGKTGARNRRHGSGLFGSEIQVKTDYTCASLSSSTTTPNSEDENDSNGQKEVVSILHKSSKEIPDSGSETQLIPKLHQNRRPKPSSAAPPLKPETPLFLEDLTEKSSAILGPVSDEETLPPPPFFTAIPGKARYKIFQYLSSRDRASCQLVCRQMRNEVRRYAGIVANIYEDSLWGASFMRDIICETIRVSRFQQPRLLPNQLVYKRMYVKHLCFAGSIPHQLLDAFVVRCPVIQRLSVHCRVTENMLYPKHRSLRRQTDGWRLKDAISHYPLRLTHLHQLFIGPPDECAHETIPIMLTMFRYPVLRRLVIRVGNFLPANEAKNIHLAIFDAVNQHHMPFLKELIIKTVTYPEEAQFRRHLFLHRPTSAIIKSSQCHQLHHFTFTEPMLDYQLWPLFICEQKGLKTLQFLQLVQYPVYLHVIPQNRHTLVKIGIQICLWVKKGFPIRLDMALFALCQNLKELFIHVKSPFIPGRAEIYNFNKLPKTLEVVAIRNCLAQIKDLWAVTELPKLRSLGLKCVTKHQKPAYFLCTPFLRKLLDMRTLEELYLRGFSPAFGSKGVETIGELCGAGVQGQNKLVFFMPNKDEKKAKWVWVPYQKNIVFKLVESWGYDLLHVSPPAGAEAVKLQPNSYQDGLSSPYALQIQNNFPKYPTIPLASRFSTCVTISLIYNFLLTSGSELESSFIQLGYYELHICRDYGVYCRFSQEFKGETGEIFGVPLITLPIYLFFVVDEESVPNFQEELTKENYADLISTPYLANTFRISYSLNFNNYPEVELDKMELASIVYMCAYCDLSMPELDFNEEVSQSGYMFINHFVNGDDPNFRVRMMETYLNVTKDGLNLLYFIHGHDYLVDLIHNDLERLLEIQKSSKFYDIFKIIKPIPTLDEIILSILIDPIPYERLYMKGSQFTKYPLIGIVDVNVLQKFEIPIRKFEILQMEQSSYKFVTCHGHRYPIDFYIYVNRFQNSVWLGLFGSIAISVVVIVRASKRDSEANSVSVLLTIVGLLLNTFVNPSKMDGQRVFRCFLGVWGLSSIVLNTAYMGSNYAGSFAPNHFMETTTLDKIVNFTLYSPTRNNCQKDNTNENEEWEVALCTDIGTKIYYWLTDDILDDEKSLEFEEIDVVSEDWKIFGSVLDTFPFKHRTDQIIASLFHRIRPVFENRSAYILPLIAKCDETAFIGNDLEIKNLFEGIEDGDSWQKTEEPLYTGKDTIFESSPVWYVMESGGKFFSRRKKYLGESGLQQFWKSMIGHLAKQRDRYSTRNNEALSNKPIGLSLESNFITVFFLLIICSVVSIISLGMEHLMKVLK